jgi:hypothetical protein
MPFGLLAIACLSSHFDPPRAVRARRAAITAVVIAAIALPGWGLLNLNRNSIGLYSHQWVDSYLQSSREYSGNSYFDTQVPTGVVPDIFFPYSRLSGVLPVIDPVATTNVVSPTALVVAEDGWVAPGSIVSKATVTLSDPQSLAANPALGPGCWTVASSHASVGLSVNPVLPAGRWFIQLRAGLDRGSEITMIAGASRSAVDSGQVGIEQVHAPKGSSVVTAGFSSRPLGWIRVELRDVDSVCFSDFVVGSAQQNQ